jgi:hypothetical protein
VNQHKLATGIEREILRVEDRYHELLAKIASRSMPFSSVMKEIALLRIQQAELRAKLDEVRRDLDPIYRSAFDLRIDSLNGLEGRVHRMSSNKSRASSPDPNS